MPLVYSGQEAGLRKRLEFFAKDPIEWNEHSFTSIYRSLLNTKKKHPALWNGTAGGDMIRVKTSHDDDVFAFCRTKAENRVLVITNLSENSLTMTLEDSRYHGTYSDVFTGETAILDPESKMQLIPWGYGVFVQ